MDETLVNCSVLGINKNYIVFKKIYEVVTKEVLFTKVRYLLPR